MIRGSIFSFLERIAFSISSSNIHLYNHENLVNALVKTVMEEIIPLCHNLSVTELLELVGPICGLESAVNERSREYSDNNSSVYRHVRR